MITFDNDDVENTLGFPYNLTGFEWESAYFEYSAITKIVLKIISEYEDIYSCALCFIHSGNKIITEIRETIQNLN